MSLTLGQVLDIAARRNPDLRVVEQGVEVARTGIAIAEQRPNPYVNMSSPFGPAERKQRVMFNVPLELGGRRQARLTVAEDGVKEAELTLAQSRLVVANQARNAFIELAVAEATVRQSQVDLEFYDRLVQAARSRFQAGDIPEADVVRSVFERDQNARLLYPAENRRGSAVLTLNRLLGQPLATSIGVVDDGLLFPNEATLRGTTWELPPLPELQQMARERRPDLALAAQQLETAKHRVDMARAYQSPDVSLQATMMYDPQFPGLTYQAGVQLELPWGSDRSGEVKQARAREAEAIARNESTLQSADLAVSLAWTNLQNAREQLLHDLALLQPQADQVLELAQKTFELGQGDITEVLLAGQSVQRQRQIFLADVAQFHRALGELELAINVPLTGGLP